jgi:hypothetical protein
VAPSEAEPEYSSYAWHPFHAQAFGETAGETIGPVHYIFLQKILKLKFPQSMQV